MADPNLKESGFSLVEVLVALMIVALISSAGTAILIQTVDSRTALERVSDRVNDINETHALMREDLAQLVMRDFRARENLDRPARFVGGETAERGHVMSFVRDGWLNPGYLENRSGLIVVRYLVEDESLIRRVRLAPDGVLGTETIDEVLIIGISEHRVQFYDGNSWLSQWNGLAGNAGGAPVAVRISFTTESGRGYDWKFLTSVGSSVS